jgi:hypothetical protein
MTAVSLRMNIMRSSGNGSSYLATHKHRARTFSLSKNRPYQHTKPTSHRLWRLYRPTHTEEGTRKCSLYINQRISTSAHPQVRYNSPERTAAKIWIETQMLVFSVYVPPVSYRQISERVAMQPTLEEIQATNQAATRETSKPTKIVIAGDFNRRLERQRSPSSLT